MVFPVTSADFQSQVLTSDKPVLVDFWSPTCGPCRMQEPALDQLEVESNGRFQFAKVNVWDEPDLAAQFHVTAVPTLLVFSDGRVTQSFVGLQQKAKLQRALEQALQTSGSPA